MPIVVDQISHAGGAFTPFSDSGMQYAGQIFTAAGASLDKVEFPILTYSGPDSATEFKLLVTTVTFDGNGFHPGTVLFESALIADPVSAALEPHIVTVDTGGLALTPGQQYAFIIDAFVASDGQASSSWMYNSHSGAFGTPDYTGGYRVTYQADGGDRASHFAADWNDGLQADASFRLTFTNPGVTIVGKGKDDHVDEDHSVGNQPFPGGLDDIISGKGGDDDLSALAGDDKIDGGRGNDRLDGGDGNDGLAGGGGDDTILGGAGDDEIDGGGGNDRIKAGDGNESVEGGRGDDRIKGGLGNHQINGGAGNDKLKGGEGDDALIGGKGGDTLSGEGGRDSFIFNESPEQPFDKIKGYSLLDDTMVLDNAFFSLVEGPLAATAFAVGTKAGDGDDRVIYDSASGKVRYDSDGNGNDDPLVFVKIDKGLALTHDDFLVV